MDADMPELDRTSSRSDPSGSSRSDPRAGHRSSCTDTATRATEPGTTVTRGLRRYGAIVFTHGPLLAADMLAAQLAVFGGAVRAALDCAPRRCPRRPRDGDDPRSRRVLELHLSLPNPAARDRARRAARPPQRSGSGQPGQLMLLHMPRFRRVRVGCANRKAPPAEPGAPCRPASGDPVRQAAAAEAHRPARASADDHVRRRPRLRDERHRTCRVRPRGRARRASRRGDRLSHRARTTSVLPGSGRRAHHRARPGADGAPLGPPTPRFRRSRRLAAASRFSPLQRGFQGPLHPGKTPAWRIG
jgi:hypothetical protein